MAVTLFATMPTQDPMVEVENPEILNKLDKKIMVGIGRLLVTRVWVDWYTTINQRLDASPTSSTTPISLKDQSASIGTKAFVIPSLPRGFYRVSYYMRATTKATTSSGLKIMIGNTDNGVTCTQVSPSMNWNDVQLPMSGVFCVYADADSIITYATDYVSVGATAMVYKLVVSVESVALV